MIKDVPMSLWRDTAILMICVPIVIVIGIWLFYKLKRWAKKRMKEDYHENY